MTAAELVAIAEARGYVRWTKSGLVEWLRIGKTGRIIAEPTPKHSNGVHVLHLCRMYACEEHFIAQKDKVAGVQ